MLSRNRIIAASGAVAEVVAVFAGVERDSADTASSASRVRTAQSADEAQITGYASSPLTSGPSGPVSVLVHGAPAARIDQLINGLHAWSGRSSWNRHRPRRVTALPGQERDAALVVRVSGWCGPRTRTLDDIRQE